MVDGLHSRYKCFREEKNEKDKYKLAPVKNQGIIDVAVNLNSFQILVSTALTSGICNFFFFFFFRWRYSPLWALACRTIPLHLSLSPTFSIFSLPALEDLFLLLLSSLSWVFLFVSSFPVLE